MRDEKIVEILLDIKNSVAKNTKSIEQLGVMVEAMHRLLFTRNGGKNSFASLVQIHSEEIKEIKNKLEKQEKERKKKYFIRYEAVVTFLLGIISGLFFLFLSGYLKL